MKGERDQTESLNTVAVKTALEETPYPCLVTHQWGVREFKCQMSCVGLNGAFFVPFLSDQTLGISSHPPLELLGWGFVMSRLTQGLHCLGSDLLAS